MSLLAMSWETGSSSEEGQVGGCALQDDNVWLCLVLALESLNSSAIPVFACGLRNSILTILHLCSQDGFEVVSSFGLLLLASAIVNNTCTLICVSRKLEAVWECVEVYLQAGEYNLLKYAKVSIR